MLRRLLPITAFAAVAVGAGAVTSAPAAPSAGAAQSGDDANPSTVHVDSSHSRSKRRSTFATDIAPCDQVLSAYDCYKGRLRIWNRRGKLIVSRPFRYDDNGEQLLRYKWSCRSTGRLRWRITVAAQGKIAHRNGRFTVTRCS
jgi:hypothetical protein